jgi:hypothetical protein
MPSWFANPVSRVLDDLLRQGVSPAFSGQGFG